MTLLHPIDNFDFLIGKWSVLNKRLNERLVQCTEWTTFQAEMQTKPILNGLGLMDEMKSSQFGNDFIGLSIRMVNPKTNVWTIYWADTLSPENYLKDKLWVNSRMELASFLAKKCTRKRNTDYDSPGESLLKTRHFGSRLTSTIGLENGRRTGL